MVFPENRFVFSENQLVYSEIQCVFPGIRFDESKNRFSTPLFALPNAFGGKITTPFSAIFCTFKTHTSKNDLTESFVQLAESVVESDEAIVEPDERISRLDSTFVGTVFRENQPDKSFVQSDESPVESDKSRVRMQPARLETFLLK